MVHWESSEADEEAGWFVNAIELFNPKLTRDFDFCRYRTGEHGDYTLEVHEFVSFARCFLFVPKLRFYVSGQQS